MKTPMCLKSVKRFARITSNLVLVVAALSFSTHSLAQITTTIGVGSQTGISFNGATGDAGPMYRSGSTDNFIYSRYHYLYTQAELMAAGISAGMNLTKLAWHKDVAAATNSIPAFQIWIKNSAKTTVGAGGQKWTDLIMGSTQVYNNPALNMTAPPQWHEFIFSSPFLYTGGAIEISVDFDISAGTSPWTSAGFSWAKDPVSDRTLSYVGANAPPATLPNLRTVRPQIQITCNAASSCTAPPVSGSATSSSTVVCPNTSFALDVAGNSPGFSQTYQWESSPTGSAPWTSLGPPSNNSYFITAQTSTHYYRVNQTCSGLISTSLPVLVTTNTTPVSGTFTINKNAFPSATNFKSFEAAIAHLECSGVNGPVVFNVVAGSGPYLEQIVVPEIAGASATNTITFNGNGNRITAAASAAYSGIITLDGADYMEFNNFILDVDANSSAGWGLQLINEANFNLLTNSTINLPLTSTSTNFNGIVFGATTATAANNGNFNIFSNNTINGGYYAIRINGPAGTVGATGNKITGNTIQDCYTYNFYLNNTESTVVENNIISRPNRSTVGTFYGVYLIGTSKSNIISRNRFHNAFGGVSSPTGSVYVIYFTSSNAPNGSENIIKNNLIYNINTNGTIYALYNSGSSGAHYFHNTLDLNLPANTGTIRGFYQNNVAANIRLQNNIISLSGGTSGAKHALYFGTTASVITSDQNVLHVSGGANLASWGSANQATLAAWQTASTNDANSVTIDPSYAAPATGNFKPNNAGIDNIGAPLGVTDDITGALRSSTTPDPGAYEVTFNINDVGVTAITSLPSGCGFTNTHPITITVKNFGSAPQSNIPVKFMVGANIIGNETIPGPLASNASASFTFNSTANLSAPGPYVIKAQTFLNGDTNTNNDSFTQIATNSLIPTLPIRITFENLGYGINDVRVVTNNFSTVTESPAAAYSGYKGLLMAGISNSGWQAPVGTIDPWTNNSGNFSAIYLCVNPVLNKFPHVPYSIDSLYLLFDLKQLFKSTNANTNFRVTINGQQVTPTIRPPFTGPSSGWKVIRVDLTPFLGQKNVQIGLESSVKEEFASGSGTANLIDNIRIDEGGWCYILGTGSVKLENQIKVYPNPGSGIFTILVPQGNHTLEVTDMTGKTILKQPANGAATQLNLKDAAKGIYLLKITSEGSIATKRLVIE